MYNLKAKCVECGSDNIIYDKSHAEIYCNECGLVLVKLYKIPNDNLFFDYDFKDYNEIIDSI